MKNLRRLCAAIILTSVLGLSAFAGETMTPPCAPPEPGETMTPPCAIAQAPTPDDMGTPAALATAPGDIDMPRLTEIAANVLQSIWSLF